MQTILSFLKESQGITNNNPDSCKAIEELNLARQLLWRLDDWVGTIEYLCVSVGNCFYTPWHIETIRAAWSCNRNLEIGSAFYSEIGYDDVCACAGNKIHIIRTGAIDVFPCSIRRGSKIGFECSNRNDTGKKVIITYTNKFGSITVDEIQLTEVGVTVYTSEEVNTIESVSKEKTEGVVRVKSLLYGIRDVVTLYPDQTFIEYPRYSADSCVNCQILIKGKKRFIPYTRADENRPLDISSPDGLRFAIKAIQAEKNNDLSAYTANLTAAKSHLEKEKEDINRTTKPSKVIIKQGYYPLSSSVYGGWD